MDAVKTSIAARLAQPPVVDTLEFGTEQLNSGRKWLTSTVREHERELTGFRARLSLLDGGRPAAGDATATPRGAEPAASEAGALSRTIRDVSPGDDSGAVNASQKVSSSLREEFVAEQIAFIQHELATLPKPGELLEQQRGVAQAEAAAVSEALKDLSLIHI